MLMSIKELKVNEDDSSGIQAVSFVDEPAIETNFEYFAVNKPLPFFKYTAYPEPEIIPTSHEFCKKHATGEVYHESEIKLWNYPTEKGWIPTENFFTTFDADKGGYSSYDDSYNYNCSSQLYECRHKLRRISKVSEIPANKRYLAPKDIKFNSDHFVKFESVSEAKHEVKGLVLKSNQLIYRNDLGNGEPGYVFFSRDTIRKLKEKYGFNRSITFQHESVITGQAILLDTWLEESDTETKWFMKYKIVGDKLWQAIVSKKVRGYSIEGYFS